MNKEKSQEDYIRGQQAEAVLTNEAYIDSYETIKRKLVDDLINTLPFQFFLRQEIYRRLKIMALQRQVFEAEMQSGKLSKKRLEAKK